MGHIDSRFFGERFIMLRLLALLLAVLSGCSFGPGNLQTSRSTDLEKRKIRRIVVLPPEMATAEQKPKVPFTSPSPATTKTPERQAPELLANLIYSTMASMPNWQIVSESEIREIERGVPQTNGVARIRKLGELVYADAVITGRIQRYRERVGDEWGAKSPASVAFVLDLIDVRRGDTVWSARFDETQKPLSENIFAIGDLSQRGVRWLSASQLTQAGVKKAVSDLHELLVRRPS
jgi:TolB-like protein